MSEARESFRQRLAAAVATVPTPERPLPEPLPVTPAADLATQFAAALEKLTGEVIRAASAEEAARELLTRTDPQDRPWFVADRPLAQALAAHLPVTWTGREQLADCQASVTEADWLLADTGSVGLALDAHQPRSCYLLPEIHVAVATLDRLLPSLAEALLRLEEQPLPTGYVFVTGPSRTADIEKTIVIPAHGPKRLITVLLEGTK